VNTYECRLSPSISKNHPTSPAASIDRPSQAVTIMAYINRESSKMCMKILHKSPIQIGTPRSWCRAAYDLASAAESGLELYIRIPGEHWTADG
jgi:hypothetical protein